MAATIPTKRLNGNSRYPYRHTPTNGSTHTDIETGETFSYDTYEQTDGTLFEPDAAKEQALFAQLWDWEPSEYNDMVVASQLLFNHFGCNQNAEESGRRGRS